MNHQGTILKEKAWKWMGWGVAGMLALQLYFVREMIVAEVIFAVVFVGLAVGAAVFCGLSAFGIRVARIAERGVAALHGGRKWMGEFIGNAVPQASFRIHPVTAEVRNRR